MENNYSRIVKFACYILIWYNVMVDFENETGLKWKTILKYSNVNKFKNIRFHFITWYFKNFFFFNCRNRFLKKMSCST